MEHSFSDGKMKKEQIYVAPLHPLLLPSIYFHLALVLVETERFMIGISHSFHDEIEGERINYSANTRYFLNGAH